MLHPPNEEADASVEGGNPGMEIMRETKAEIGQMDKPSDIILDEQQDEASKCSSLILNI